jgi:hypothetical protein
LSGEAIVSMAVDNPVEWIDFSRNRGWWPLPEELVFSAGPVTIQGSTAWTKGQAHSWSAGMKTTQMSASVGATSLSVGTLLLDARMTDEPVRSLALSVDIADAFVLSSGVSLESPHVEASIEGSWPGPMEGALSLREGQLTWSDGAGLLSGLDGAIALKSLQPPITLGDQLLRFTSMAQGDFSANSGRIRFSYEGERDDRSPLELDLTAAALGGKIRVVVEGSIVPALSLAVRIYLEGVELEQIAALFPQFDGRIQGLASGELALRIEEGRIVLQPGGLQLVPHSTGRFAYLRQGWLTQNPDLDPEAFVRGRDIVDVMQDSQGSSVITELAMRDLSMSEFRIDILMRNSGAARVAAQIKGNGEVKGMTVPVVLNVPIRGDVKETINAILKFNSRM